MSLRATTVLVVVLTLTAGCLGLGGDDPGPDGTDTPTPTAEPTATPTAAADSAYFNVSLRNSNLPIGAGQELAAIVEVTNTGQLEGTQRIGLVVEGEVVDTAQLTLAPGASDLVELNWQTSEDDLGRTVEVLVESDDETFELGQ
jgi:hypothetical protein